MPGEQEDWACGDAVVPSHGLRHTSAIALVSLMGELGPSRAPCPQDTLAQQQDTGQEVSEVEFPCGEHYTPASRGHGAASLCPLYFQPFSKHHLPEQPARCPPPTPTTALSTAPQAPMSPHVAPVSLRGLSGAGRPRPPRAQQAAATSPQWHLQKPSSHAHHPPSLRLPCRARPLNASGVSNCSCPCPCQAARKTTLTGGPALPGWRPL